MPAIRLSAVVLLCAIGTSAQSSSERMVARVFGHRVYRAGIAAMDRTFPDFARDVVALTEVPAPPFKEAARAAATLALFRSAGLGTAAIDAVGNVVALRPGTGGPVLVIAAHLDTVFPDGTDVRVTRDGTRLKAPGIGDNALGVAVLIAVARALNAAQAETTNDILFVANVGEEATGDLRGVKHLFAQSPHRRRIRQFVAIDGVGDGSFITTVGVASLRYRVTFRGPGGHSFGGFGLVNPANAMADAIQSLSALDVPDAPRTTFNVGMVGGGTSVNSIPSSVWMDVDLRSESVAELARLDRSFQSLVREAATRENQAHSPAMGRIEAIVEQLGARSGGRTSQQSALVTTAAAAIRTLGLLPTYGSASTDANLPMSLGVPAITIDAGIPGGRPHAPDEWVDLEKHAALGGLQRTLLLVLSLAGLK